MEVNSAEYLERLKLIKRSVPQVDSVALSQQSNLSLEVEELTTVQLIGIPAVTFNRPAAYQKMLEELQLEMARWSKPASLLGNLSAKYAQELRVKNEAVSGIEPSVIEVNARVMGRLGSKPPKPPKPPKPSKPPKPPMPPKPPKCRAKYGPHQLQLWCKPCRSRKKCIRFAMMGGEQQLAQQFGEGGGNSENDFDEDESLDAGTVLAPREETHANQFMTTGKIII